jgi:hypothetical protein
MGEKEDTRAKEQARAQLDSIMEMVKALDGGGEIDGEEIDEETVRERIQEDPLSVEVRSDWHEPGSKDDKPTAYNILLCTGGPAVRIVGTLDEYGQPETAQIEYQDWFTPWVSYADTSSEEDDALLTYARQFYYRE